MNRIKDNHNTILDNNQPLSKRLNRIGLTQKQLRGYFKRSKQQIWDSLQPGTKQISLRTKIEKLVEKKESEFS